MQMEIKTLDFSIQTKGSNDIRDISEEVQKIVTDSKMKEGSALVFVPGSTAGITTIEYEKGLLKDYPQFFEKIIPSGVRYNHDDTWNDGNGFSHIRASIQGASFTVPFAEGKLLLGTWQQIILIDFDNIPRNRKVIVQLTGN
jgi:secondary thiamine-phosphate synthase enzyme